MMTSPCKVGNKNSHYLFFFYPFSLATFLNLQLQHIVSKLSYLSNTAIETLVIDTAKEDVYILTPHVVSSGPVIEISVMVNFRSIKFKYFFIWTFSDILYYVNIFPGTSQRPRATKKEGGWQESQRSKGNLDLGHDSPHDSIIYHLKWFSQVWDSIKCPLHVLTLKLHTLIFAQKIFHSTFFLPSICSIVGP